MKIAIASDERTLLTTSIISDLQKRGHTLTLYGPLSSAEDPETDWPVTSSRAAEAVAHGEADEGIVFCWTGTGASLAATKSMVSVLRSVMMRRRQRERRSGTMRMCWRLV